MPTYTCTTAEGRLTADQKAAVAAAVTAAHAEITGAPPYFAQVMFNTVADGDHFMGGKPLGHDSIFVYGRIRGDGGVRPHPAGSRRRADRRWSRPGSGPA